MSNSVLPSFPGLAWDSHRYAEWDTFRKESVSGRRVTASNWSYPRWRYKMSFEVLRARQSLTEMQTLAAFFNARNGKADTFLFNDVDDNTATNQGFGIGNGVNKVFQLVRSFGGYTEPVFNLNSVPTIWKNGLLQIPGTDYSVTMLSETGAGVVTFVATPANGDVLTWSGTFYWRCEFTKDELDFQQFMKNLWKLGSFEFQTVKP